MITLDNQLGRNWQSHQLADFATMVEKAHYEKIQQKKLNKKQRNRKAYDPYNTDGVMFHAASSLPPSPASSHHPQMSSSSTPASPVNIRNSAANNTNSGNKYSKSWHSTPVSVSPSSSPTTTKCKKTNNNNNGVFASRKHKHNNNDIYSYSGSSFSFKGGANMAYYEFKYTYTADDNSGAYKIREEETVRMYSNPDDEEEEDRNREDCQDDDDEESALPSVGLGFEIDSSSDSNSDDETVGIEVVINDCDDDDDDDDDIISFQLGRSKLDSDQSDEDFMDNIMSVLDAVDSSSDDEPVKFVASESSDESDTEEVIVDLYTINRRGHPYPPVQRPPHYVSPIRPIIPDSVSHLNSGRKRGGQVNSGAHSWPMKHGSRSRLPSCVFDDDDDQCRRKKLNPAKKKEKKPRKKTNQSLYTSIFTSAKEMPTKARGWVQGGLVLADDLLRELQQRDDVVLANHLPPSTTVSKDDGDKVDEDVMDTLMRDAEVRDIGGNSQVQFSSVDDDDSTPARTKKLSLRNKPAKTKANYYDDDDLEMEYEIQAAPIPDTDDLAALNSLCEQEQLYYSMLNGEYKGGKSEKKKRGKAYANKLEQPKEGYDVIDLIDIIHQCTSMLRSGSLVDSITLPAASKIHRVQMHALASLYNLPSQSNTLKSRTKKKKVVISKHENACIPSNTTLAKFIHDCITGPEKMRETYIEVDLSSAPQKKQTNQYFRVPAKKPARLTKMVGEWVAEDAPPVSSDTLGHKMLSSMGWNGGGLGANGQGIAAPIQAKIKHTRAGLGDELPKK